MDIRKVLEPYTALNLKVKRKNVIKDFVSIAGLLNVTHLIILTRTTKAMYLRFCRLSRGPTLVFKIVNYTLARDVISNLRKPAILPGLHLVSPLLVMNGFSVDEDFTARLITSMFRNLFPPIDVNKVNLNTVKRAVLINYNEDTKLIDFRHYSIRAKPVGLSKPVKKLLIGKKIPNLGKLRSIDDMFHQDLSCTESEGEGLDEVEEERHVTLPQQISARGNLVNEKSAIRLTELGPRMTLELMKIQEGLMSGEVLYHSLFNKQKKARNVKRRRMNVTKDN